MPSKPKYVKPCPHCPSSGTQEAHQCCPKKFRITCSCGSINYQLSLLQAAKWLQDAKLK